MVILPLHRRSSPSFYERIKQRSLMVFPDFHSFIFITRMNVIAPSTHFNHLKSHGYTDKPYGPPKAAMLSMISADVLAQGRWSERRNKWGRERGRMLPAENGCCNLKPILIHRNDIKVERKWAGGRERKIRKMRADGERMCMSLSVSWKEDKKRERGDPGVGCCKRRATPSHGGRVSPYIFIFNTAHIYSEICQNG